LDLFIRNAVQIIPLLFCRVASGTISQLLPSIYQGKAEKMVRSSGLGSPRILSNPKFRCIGRRARRFPMRSQ